MLSYFSRLNDDIRVWRSLVSRLNGVQEASSSNLDTRTKKSRTAFAVLDFFFLYVEIRTVSCECPVDIRSFPARRERLLNYPNLDTRAKKGADERRRRRLDGAEPYVLHRQNSIESRHSDQKYRHPLSV